jgi:hypothetical protein
MAIAYEEFMKHAAKICRSEAIGDRQILTGVKHLENGDAIATDSHRLYLARAIHDHRDGAVLTPEGRRLTGNYPEVSRIIPSNDPVQQLQMDTKELMEAADAIYTVGSLIEGKRVPLQFCDNFIRYDSLEVNYSRTFSVQFECSCYVNAKYFLEALKLFKAAGCSTVSVRFYGKMRPVRLTGEDENLDVIILPVRKY